MPEFIPHAGGYICAGCGALIPAKDLAMSDHIDWHRRIDSIEERLEYALNRQGDPT
jgi:hypothetical protein